jgi:hypothetical protein
MTLFGVFSGDSQCIVVVIYWKNYQLAWAIKFEGNILLIVFRVKSHSEGGGWEGMLKREYRVSQTGKYKI